jgi:hypothetical protein
MDARRVIQQLADRTRFRKGTAARISRSSSSLSYSRKSRMIAEDVNWSGSADRSGRRGRARHAAMSARPWVSNASVSFPRMTATRHARRAARQIGRRATGARREVRRMVSVARQPRRRRRSVRRWRGGRTKPWLLSGLEIIASLCGLASRPPDLLLIGPILRTYPIPQQTGRTPRRIGQRAQLSNRIASRSAQH